MEVATKKMDASDASDEQKPEKPAKKPGGPLNYRGPGAGSEKPGYFRIYKKGQGYWTRMGTVGGVALIGALTANFLWDERSLYSQDPHRADNIAYIVVASFLVVFIAISYFILNKPSNVEFLISTDTEMKKVNWTTRKQLVSSTRVVVLFVVVMAIVLFGYDLLFHTFFYLIGVLKTPPPFFPVH